MAGRPSRNPAIPASPGRARRLLVDGRMMAPVRVSTLLVFALVSLGCGAKSKKPATSPSPSPSPRITRPTKPPADGTGRATPDAPADDDPTGLWSPIYFEFDSPKLGPEAREQLSRIAEWMKSHAQATVEVSGHADERGTEEYNLTLGDQRAQACGEYIRRAGVARPRVKTISWGEQHPAVSGDGEMAWAKNRRCEFEPAR